MFIEEEKRHFRKSLMEMHWRCKIVLHDQPIKTIILLCHIKKVGCSGVTWRKTWLVLVDCVKLFYTVGAYTFFSFRNYIDILANFNMEHFFK
jgi:hypothetical protein